MYGQLVGTKLDVRFFSDALCSIFITNVQLLVLSIVSSTESITPRTLKLDNSDTGP